MATTLPGSLETAPTQPVVERTESENALTQMLPEISAVTKEQLQTIGVDVRRAALIVLGSLMDIRRHGDALVAARVTPEVLDALRTCALAAYEAETRYAALSKAGESLQPLFDEVSKTRDLLISVVEMFTKLRLMDGSTLKSLKGAQGYEPVSSDVGTLVTALRDAAPKIGTRSPLTEAELTSAREAAAKLAQAWASRELGEELASEAGVLRHKAYSLLVKRYDFVRKGVNYVRWEEGDADAIAPSLFANRGNTRKKPEDAAPGTPPAAPAGGAAPPAAPGSDDESPFDPR